MEYLDDVSGREHASPMVHCWDPQARRVVCGAPGQTGSTKHVRAVTCSACLEGLGRAALSVAP